MTNKLAEDFANHDTMSYDQLHNAYHALNARCISLETELTFHRVELEKYRNEAMKAYALSKERGEDNAMLSAQADMILRDLQSVNTDLRQKIRELEIAKASLRESYKDAINRLVVASEYKDNETGAHIVRISTYSGYIAGLYGFDDDAKDEIEFASPMHDVGKIGIRDSILFKNGKLTAEEFDEMKRHTTIGATILKNADSPILECARMIALCHHEKWNGGGYPNGIAGKNIPIQARIVSVCDTFDALTSKRPYKNPYPLDVSCDIIKKGRGVDFDPDVVDIFLANIDGIVAIKNRINESCADEDEIKANFKWSERDSV